MESTVVVPPATRLAQHRLVGWRSKVADYWSLTKPEVNSLVVASTLAGFYLAWRGPMNYALMIHTLVGTLLVASGTATLNQWVEREFDARMRRTANRPLPAGRLSSSEALWFGIGLSVAGGLELALAVNILASCLALLTLASYLLLYTPLKRKTSYCTLVGAFPGAMPPLIGWAAARGNLNLEAWILYALLFFWQFPHFLSIAWMYREDYERAGLLMLPPNDPQGRLAARQILATSIALLPVSLLPTLLGQLGMIYFFGALPLGLAILYYGASTALVRSKVMARRLLLASVFYLPLVFGLMIVDKFLM
ncbi:MAG TPA: heme o synthase [Verrucomicrobiae bacterium]|nr:heme o synthase [Verrucomicrobiae bacterium]